MNICRIVIITVAFLAGVVHAADCPRIVSQSPYITRALEWLDLEKCIVGINRYDRTIYHQLPSTGGVIDPDAQEIARLRPELLITADWTSEDTWRAATPPGAVALRVGGFRGMAEVEAMLREIGRAAKVADIDARVDRFASDWRAAAARIDGRHRRALIMSACGKVRQSSTSPRAIWTPASSAEASPKDERSRATLTRGLVCAMAASSRQVPSVLPSST